VLERLRDSKGVLHTEALALAIPQLSEKVQARARGALVERMARMTARTLRDKFEDEDAEVRRAAALACARKGAKEHVPDLLRLLDDAGWPVVQAARTALTELTGKDFGPEATATLPEHTRSVAAWRKWWQEQEARK
jgi:HEAT repeat protein